MIEGIVKDTFVVASETAVRYPLCDRNETVGLLCARVQRHLSTKFPTSAPFSILRLAELVTAPLQYHKETHPEKWLRALEANVRITSSEDEFRAPEEPKEGTEPCSLVLTTVSMTEILWMVPGEGSGKDAGEDPDKDLGKAPSQDPGKATGKDPSKDPSQQPGRHPHPENRIEEISLTEVVYVHSGIAPPERTSLGSSGARPREEENAVKDYTEESPFLKKLKPSPNSSPVRETPESPTKGEQFSVPMDVCEGEVVSDEEPLNSPGKYQRVP